MSATGVPCVGKSVRSRATAPKWIEQAIHVPLKPCRRILSASGVKGRDQAIPAAETAVEVATVFFRRRIEVGTQNVGGASGGRQAPKSSPPHPPV